MPNIRVRYRSESPITSRYIIFRLSIIILKTFYIALYESLRGKFITSV
jgi:hypothetical protein